jgi:hypothetical protein
MREAEEAIRENAAALAACTAALRGAASPIAVTFWPDLACSVGAFEVVSIHDFRARVTAASAATKSALPSFSAARFGDTRSAAGSLRHGSNLLQCTAVCGDHDAATLTPTEAADRLRTARLVGFIYSTPSHRPGKPRWRVVVPLSQPCAPADYRRHVDALDAALGGGVLARESRVPAQLWFYGRIAGRPVPEVHVVDDGEAIDEAAPVASDAGDDGDTDDDLANALHAAGVSRLGLAAPIEVVASALSAIPNTERSWETWNKIGMAAFAATQGNEAGLEAWSAWSARHPAHEENACRRRWSHYSSSPPTAIGAGTLFHEAARHDWSDPRKEAPPDSGGDLSNARVLADRMRGDFLFDRSARHWRRFDGVRWVQDAGEAMQAAKAVADQRLRDAARSSTTASTRTGGRSSSSSRAGSARARCRRSSSLGRRARGS